MAVAVAVAGGKLKKEEVEEKVSGAGRRSCFEDGNMSSSKSSSRGCF